MSATNNVLRDPLRSAAEQALRAPSILNTQPWRWSVDDNGLDLFADRTRQLPSIDTDGRLLTLSCGAALHHARVALAAAGHDVDVTRFPDPTNPDLLARIRVVGQHDVGYADTEVMRWMHRRRTDRRPIAATVAVPEEAIASLRRAAETEQARLHRVGEDQVPFLTMAADTAAAAEGQDERYQADLDRWTHRKRSTGDGVTAETVAAQVPRPVRLRDFEPGRETLLHPGWGDDTFAAYLIVATAADDHAAWLRAGEATSAVWLTATGAGLAMSVMSDMIEVPAARALLRGLLTPTGFPQLVLRTGLDVQPAPPATTPRRHPDEVIHNVA